MKSKKHSKIKWTEENLLLLYSIRMQIRQANYEESRTDGDYSFTAALIREVVKPDICKLLNIKERKS